MSAIILSDSVPSVWTRRATFCSPYISGLAASIFMIMFFAFVVAPRVPFAVWIVFESVLILLFGYLFFDTLHYHLIRRPTDFLRSESSKETGSLIEAINILEQSRRHIEMFPIFRDRALAIQEKLEEWIKKEKVWMAFCSPLNSSKKGWQKEYLEGIEEVLRENPSCLGRGNGKWGYVRYFGYLCGLVCIKDYTVFLKNITQHFFGI